MKKNHTIKIIIADDHSIYLDGLKLLLAPVGNMVIVAEAFNGQELIHAVKTYEPDVVLTDIIMPVMDGITAARKIFEFKPSIGVIALSMFNEEHYIVDMLEAGALGYLLKNASKDDIVSAITTVNMGKPYYSVESFNKLSSYLTRNKLNSIIKKNAPSFTQKELEITRMVCMEKTNREIAEKLYLSIRTVEWYRIRIQEKMQVNGTAGMVVYAIRSGIYKLEEKQS